MSSYSRLTIAQLKAFIEESKAEIKKAQKLAKTEPHEYLNGVIRDAKFNALCAKHELDRRAGWKR